MISQKDGVYNAIVAFMSENERAFEDGMEVKLSGEDRAAIIGMLIATTEAGELEVKSTKAATDLKKYWNGTLSNWLRKDLRLNGNIKHEIKNPGSRAGAGDKQLTELKKLHKQVVVGGKEEVIKQVAEAIEARTEAIAAKKLTAITIDPALLPEELRHLAPTAETLTTDDIETVTINEDDVGSLEDVLGTE